ncbi:MAG: hypothetical protein JWN34_655 [Bryobacterales bacterium]|nr:hypothetical protein [Bryobacterales bacterium]
MIDVKEQNGGIVGALKLVPNAGLPAIGEVGFSFEVLLEEAFLVGNTEGIEHRLDHVHVGDEDSLGEVRGELFFVSAKALQEARHGLLQVFGIDFGKMSPRFEAVV